MVMGVGGRVLVGIFGRNGHQLSAEEIWEAGGVLLGECDKTVEKDGDKGKEGRKGERGRDVTLNERRHDVRVYDTLEDMLEEREIELVSVCGSPRSGQAKVIKRVLEAGKHVYAEKPCVMNEHDMDELLELAAARNLIFCEMAGIYYEEPYFTAGKLVREGAVGEVVQVVAQKSYPYADWRPQDERVDGGLLLQNGIYDLRFFEYMTGLTVTEAEAIETSLGNPAKGRLRMACAVTARLNNGAVASGIANYLNQPGTGSWGWEEVRIFGAKGILQVKGGDMWVDLYMDHHEVIEDLEYPPSLLTRLIHCIRTKEKLPVASEVLMHPARMAVRCHEKLKSL